MFCEVRTETDSPTFGPRNLPHGTFGQSVQRDWKGGLKLIPIYQMVDFGKVTLGGRTLSVSMVNEPLEGLRDRPPVSCAHYHCFPILGSERITGD